MGDMADGQTPDPQDAGAQAPAESGSAATPSAPQGEQAPPWGDDFDPARAWKTITSLRDKEKELSSKLSGYERAAKEREDAEKTEAQKLADRLAEAEKAADEARTELLRSRIAAKHKLPPELAELLTGKTEEELEAKASVLAEHLGGKKPPVPGRPTAAGYTTGDGTDPSPAFDPVAIAQAARRRYS